MNYILYGEETFLLNKELNKITHDILSKDSEDDEPSYHDLEKDSLENVINDCNTMPFFSNNKVVICKGATFLSAQGSLNDNDEVLLLKYLEKPNLCTTLIFTLEGANLDSRKKLNKKLQKLVRVMRYDRLEENDRNTYIRNEINKRGLVLNKDAYQCYLSRAGFDFQNIANDLNKLMLHGNPIDEVTIKALVPRPLLDDDKYKFEFIQAIYDKNAKKIFTLYHDFCELNVEPLALIGLIESQLRFLLEVKICRELGMGEKETATNLNANPYRVKKNMQNAMAFSEKGINDILNELAILDQQYKKGLLEINNGFEMWLIKRCEI